MENLKVSSYYFSPTGGTRKVADGFVKAFGEAAEEMDLGNKEPIGEEIKGDILLAAAPVFGGRIPALVSEKLGKLNGTGKKAVSLAVYGTRAYEDALLELNEVLEKRGFQVIASGAFIAHHSMAPQVGEGRPDEKDMQEIKEFAEKVLEKLSRGEDSQVKVPGNHPYKPEMKVAAAPMSVQGCTVCGACEKACPTDAIKVEENRVVTALEKCILCNACVKICPQGARILPPPVQAHTQELLSPLKDVRRENEIFL